MKNTVVDITGNVTCPHCGAVNSFSAKRSRAAKAMLIPTIGVGALLAPKHLRCNGCGHSVKPSSATAKQGRNGHGPACVCKDCCSGRLAGRRR